MGGEGSVTMWDPRTHWVIKADMPSWAKGKGAAVFWDFKGQGGNSHGDGKQMFDKQMFAGLYLKMGHRGDFISNGSC